MSSFVEGNQIDRSCDMLTLRLYYVYMAPRDKTLTIAVSTQGGRGWSDIFSSAVCPFFPSGPYCSRNDEVSHKLVFNVCLDSADICYRMERRKCGTERRVVRNICEDYMHVGRATEAARPFSGDMLVSSFGAVILWR